MILSRFSSLKARDSKSASVVALVLYALAIFFMVSRNYPIR